MDTQLFNTRSTSWEHHFTSARTWMTTSPRHSGTNLSRIAMEIGIVVSHGLWKLRSRTCGQSDRSQGACPNRKLSVVSTRFCASSGAPENDIEKQET